MSEEIEELSTATGWVDIHDRLPNEGASIEIAVSLDPEGDEGCFMSACKVTYVPKLGEDWGVEDSTGLRGWIRFWRLMQ